MRFVYEVHHAESDNPKRFGTTSLAKRAPRDEFPIKCNAAISLFVSNEQERIQNVGAILTIICMHDTGLALDDV